MPRSPDEWAEAVRHWNRLAPLPDGPLANLFWQAVIGAWPASRDFRLHAYAEKASREAGNSTRWIDSDQPFEATMHQLVDATFDDAELHASLAGVAARLTAPGSVQLVVGQALPDHGGPGVPDVYQGTELWEDSLVDPDNRRPVDHTVAAALLERIDGGWQPPIDDSGAAKLLVVATGPAPAPRSPRGVHRQYTPLVATGRGRRSPGRLRPRRP